MSKTSTDRSFPALLATAFLGALNDNFIRAALVVFAAATIPADEAALVALLAGGFLTLPFILFSGMAGALADKFDKTMLIRLTKIFELLVTVGALGAFWTGSIPGLLGVIFAMGMQSAAFGPLKQGWLPQNLPPERLVAANAWLETATFLAILTGTLAGGATMAFLGAMPVGLVAVGLSLAGLLCSYGIWRGWPAMPALHVPLNPFAGNMALLRVLRKDPVIGRATLLESWFWASGVIYLSSLPVYLKDSLQADDMLATFVMAGFAAGIGLGSWLVQHLLKGRVGLWTVAPAALVITLGSFVLHAGLVLLPAGGGTAALATLPGALVILAILVIAAAGGTFVVPLAAVVQARALPQERARTIAGKSVASAIGMSLVSILAGGAVALGFPLREVFLVLAVANTAILFAAVAFFPEDALRGVLRLVLLRWFRTEVSGEEHLSTQGPVVFVSNHQSLLDAPMIFALLGRTTCFAATGTWANSLSLRLLKRAVKISAIDHDRPMMAKDLVRDIADGSAAMIFPEGRLTATGALMKVYPGSAWIVDQSNAKIVPIHLEGLELSRWSREKKGFPRFWRPKVRIVVGAPRTLEIDPGLKGRARRARAVLLLGDILEDHRRAALDRHDTIPAAMADVARTFGNRRTAISDPSGAALTARRIALGAEAAGRVLSRSIAPGERVGVLLPSMAGVPVILTALWRMGAVPAMINPTQGIGPMAAGLGVAGVRTVISSRSMVEQGKLGELVAGLEARGFTMVWTEDVKASIGRGTRLRAALAGLFAGSRAMSGLPFRGAGSVSRDTIAIVLFTSGTEGVPKGVALSHGNLLANVAQLRARTDVNASDLIFSALPLFHSFGLTGGLLLPLVTGCETILYPSPLHMKAIPEMAYYRQPTIIFGTDTFLAGWGRRAHPYDFASLRAAISGAEPVKAATRALWAGRFGVRILEGYGATETSPVIALNTTIVEKDGTVGRLLPGMAARLEPVAGLEALRLLVRGPNVMRGYLQADGSIAGPEDGWYDTGDGFVTIAGRLKRFAKVGGEMISLAAVEMLAQRAWPGRTSAAVILPDAKRGDRIILLLEGANASDAEAADRLRAEARAAGVGEVALPGRIHTVERIPLLGSGKIDYPAATRLAETAGMADVRAA
ncbi:AMP-binding protein [Cereibacter sphaeroides]|uniref:MFS transporter n=1 Tax=Cereibacter sphaeroides TaxID=1063 RepID=UPI001F3296BD|nr:MFS transporter [Cereibacter sphaeroides]MCE6958320.1 AMP-binding protein [Cereibacter sphaeroides]MCE6971930.1 AMP-binding protein [Cereibacter sphaeroides]